MESPLSPSSSSPSKRRRLSLSPDPPIINDNDPKPEDGAATDAASHSDWCLVCGDGGTLLCCDACPNAYHLRCAGLTSMPPEHATWKCALCILPSALPIAPATISHPVPPLSPRICAFCKGRPHDVSDGSLRDRFSVFVGPIWNGEQNKFVFAHRICAIWAPRVFVRRGRMMNLISEMNRARWLFCTECTKRGAPIGCAIDECPRTYHYECAVNAQCHFLYKEFKLFCPEHAVSYQLQENYNIAADYQADSHQPRAYEASAVLYETRLSGLSLRRPNLSLSSVPLSRSQRRHHQKLALRIKSISEEAAERHRMSLERRCWMQMRSGTVVAPSIHTSDNPCAVCSAGLLPSTALSPLLSCRYCDLRVHANCYGADIPENVAAAELWTCRVCEFGRAHSLSSYSPECAICLQRGGALKRTTEKSRVEWAHVVCAFYVAELFFLDAAASEPIGGVNKAIRLRKSLLCSVCMIKGGACMQCSARTCKVAFHVTCALSSGLRLMELADGHKVNGCTFIGYCAQHTPHDDQTDAPQTQVEIEDPIEHASTHSASPVESALSVWSCVGGLSSHIDVLTEMIILPLLYPQVFSALNVTPPRGLLLYGPSGTGKTLLVRTLLAACESSGHEICMFARKASDLLSKFHGDTELNIRLLFDAAMRRQPAIIFFDELDGLAPARSAKQQQIHSSVVTSLLSCLDGLHQRGHVVVIATTNRLDSIDPALRRPGRFDRELYVPLPDVDARKQILQIHSQNFQPKLSERAIDDIAMRTEQFCGADIRALCIEAVIAAARRQVPTLTDSNFKRSVVTEALENISVGSDDVFAAITSVVPAAKRHSQNPFASTQRACKWRDVLVSSLISTAREIFTLKDVFGVGRRLLISGREAADVLPNIVRELFENASIVTLSLATLMMQPQRARHIVECITNQAHSLLVIDDVETLCAHMSKAERTILQHSLRNRPSSVIATCNGALSAAALLLDVFPREMTLTIPPPSIQARVNALSAIAPCTSQDNSAADKARLNQIAFASVRTHRALGDFCKFMQNAEMTLNALAPTMTNAN